jgi:hypothetical protein
MAVLEAWSRGIPTLITRECNLPESFVAGAALDCGFTSVAVARALQYALNASVLEWGKMSDAALGLARGPFSPDAVAEQWGKTYLGLITSGTPNP